MLFRIKQDRLYIAANCASFASYMEASTDMYGVGPRHADRLVKAHAVLQLLQGQAVKPTTERQAWARRRAAQRLQGAHSLVKASVRRLIAIPAEH